MILCMRESTYEGVQLKARQFFLVYKDNKMRNDEIELLFLSYY